MLRRPPTNLNQQAQNATVLLIREVLARGVQLAHVYVDALGRTTTYEAYLSALFPDIGFTVQAKADQTFKIVGAASVAAKVTRDAWIEGWLYEEDGPPVLLGADADEGKGEGVASRFFKEPGLVGEDVKMEEGKETTQGEVFKSEGKWVEKTGSGYPSGTTASLSLVECAC